MKKLIPILIAVLLLVSCGPAEPATPTTSTAKTDPSTPFPLTIEQTDDLLTGFQELSNQLTRYMEVKFDVDDPVLSKLSAEERSQILDYHIGFLERQNDILLEVRNLFAPYVDQDQGMTEADFDKLQDIVAKLDQLQKDAEDSPPDF